MSDNLLCNHRYAHASVKVTENRVICIGGFGTSDLNSCHRRLDDVLVIDIAKETYNVMEMVTSGSGPGM